MRWGNYPPSTLEIFSPPLLMTSFFDFDRDCSALVDNGEGPSHETRLALAFPRILDELIEPTSDVSDPAGVPQPP